jgi:hypothetical protein
MITTDSILYTPQSPVSVPIELPPDITAPASDSLPFAPSTVAPPLPTFNSLAFDPSTLSPFSSPIATPTSHVLNSSSPSTEALTCPPNPLPTSSIQPNLPTVPPHPMATRTHTGSLKPKSFADYKLFYTTNHPPASLSATPTESEPFSYTKAAVDVRWRAAMTQEFEALITHNAWTLCPKPSNQHVIRNKLVYRIKQKPDGSIERFKARLVANGFEQQNDIDYKETFSPIIKVSTIHIVLALAVHFD